MARYDHLPIWKAALDLTVAVERAVAHFPRKHKYALGADLRRAAQRSCSGVIRANAATLNRPIELDALVATIEEIKTLIAIGKELRAFHDFNQFAHIAELSVALGKQSAGWQRHASFEPRSGQKPALFQGQARA